MTVTERKAAERVIQVQLRERVGSVKNIRSRAFTVRNVGLEELYAKFVGVLK